MLFKPSAQALGMPRDIIPILVVVLLPPAQARGLLEIRLGCATGCPPAHKVVAPVCVKILVKPGLPTPSVQLPDAELLPSIPLPGEGLPRLFYLRWMLLSGPRPQQVGVRVRVRFDL